MEKGFVFRSYRLIFAALKRKNENMANHKSSLKRIRSNAVKRLRNRYQAKTTRNMVKKLRELKGKKEAGELLKTVYQMLDRLAKKNVIHKNNAANQKSKLSRFVNKLK